MAGTPNTQQSTVYGQRGAAVVAPGPGLRPVPPLRQAPDRPAADAPTSAGPASALAPSGWYPRWGKRAFDVVVSTSVLVAVAPIMVVVWLTLHVSLGRDVVIAQERVGLDGQPFAMFKFRTMRWSRRGRPAPFDGPDRRVTHKADHDPRHTPVGRALRKISLDELPQLMNVLRGDMSLVGPRPELVSVVDGIGQRGHRRHSVRPGMTGEWQVSGRQQGLPLHECFDDDLPYLARVTLRNDVSILIRTVGVVVGQGGR